MKYQNLLIVFLLISFSTNSQNTSLNQLSLEEYLGYVKKYHPVIKQAKLITSTNEAKLLKARGAFDPKIEVDFEKKEFKNTDYFEKLNSVFKIPTWYGIELKGSYENNSGQYLNPELNTPDNGLYNIGVSVPLAKNLFINKRIATLKQAKLYVKQGKLKQQLVVNDILFNSIEAYLNWAKHHQSFKVFKNYKSNAKFRLENVIKSYRAGDKPAIDTLEASINLDNRKLDLEKARIKYVKSTLELSNYLWISNNTPLTLRNNITPPIDTFSKVKVLLNNSVSNSSTAIEEHPKLKLLELKRKNLQINKNLKINNLLPKVNFQYSLLSSNVNNFDSFKTSNYKKSLQVSIPLFLRKSRGDLQLAKVKLQDINFEIAATKTILLNKIKATKQEIASLETQNNILKKLVTDYNRIVMSEKRKFTLGESSVFLINYREVKLIETQLKQIDNKYKFAKTQSKFFNLLSRLNTL